MSKYDRFRPTSIADAKERKAEVAEITNQYDNNEDSNRIKRLNIKADGTYILRLYPAHPSPGANAIEPKVVYFVPAWVNKKDESGKWILKPGSQTEYLQELKVRTVFDARVHGGSEHDLVDTYINLVKKKADQLYPESIEAKKAYLAPVIGNKFTGGPHMGIQPLRSFVAYGDLIEDDKQTFYEFEFGRAVEKGIYKIAAIEADGEPIGTDGCFTDPLTGRPAKVKVDRAAGKLNIADYYTVSLLTETHRVEVNGKFVSAIKEYPISEEKLDWYADNVEPLIKYRSAFKHSDLNLQLEGLKLFEAEHKFGILEMDEFTEVYKYLSNKFPYVENEDSQKSDDDMQTNNYQKASKSDDEFDLMDMVELKQYVKENKLGFIVLPSMSENDVREMIRVVLADKVEQEVVSDVDDQDDVPASENWRERIKSIRDKTSNS